MLLTPQSQNTPGFSLSFYLHCQTENKSPAIHLRQERQGLPAVAIELHPLNKRFQEQTQRQLAEQAWFCTEGTFSLAKTTHLYGLGLGNAFT